MGNNNVKLTNKQVYEMQVDYIINCLEEADQFAKKNNVKRAKVVK